MAVQQGKHSPSRAQDRRRRAHATTRSRSTARPRATTRQAKTKRAAKTRSHRHPKQPKQPKKSKKRERLSPLLRYTEKRRGKTRIRRYSNRGFHQMEEFKGKVVELVQIFTSSDYNSISVRFQDKTSLDFIIDTCFTVDTDYTDWKTGNMRRIKRWPIIHSETP